MGSLFQREAAVLFIAVGLCCSPADAQTASSARAIPRDDYFTLESVARKVHRAYPSARLAVAALPAGVTAKKELVYSRVGSRELHADLFLPRNPGLSTHPCILFLHGGGWRSGDKSMEWPLAMRLAARGYVTATVEYRLSPEAKYPAAVHDLKTSVRWLRHAASEFHIDTNHIAIVGFSSGGHLAALLGATNGDPVMEGLREFQEHTSSVQAVINVDGDVDLTESEAVAKDTIPEQPSSEARWLGGRFSEMPERWREASAYYHLSRRMPPILFLNSSLPGYRAGRDKMVHELLSLGVDARCVEIADSPHAFWLFDQWFDQTLETITAFLGDVSAP